MIKTPPKAYELGRQAVKQLSTAERLACMRQYVKNNPAEMEEYAEYIALLERLLNEQQNHDYSDPVTQYGCLIHFRSLSEDEFVEKLRGMGVGSPEPMPKAALRKAHKNMMKVEVPVLAEAERLALYDLWDDSCPTLEQLFRHDLQEPAGEAIWEYCAERGNFKAHEDSGWLAETVIEPLFELRPDIREAVVKTISQQPAQAFDLPEAESGSMRQKTMLDLLTDFQRMSLCAFQAEIQAVFGDSAQPVVIAGLHHHIQAIQMQAPTAEDVKRMICGGWPIFLSPFYESLTPAEDWLLSQYFNAKAVFDTFLEESDQIMHLDWIITKARWDQDFRGWLLAEVNKPLPVRELEPVDWEHYGEVDPDFSELETESLQPNQHVIEGSRAS